MDSSDASNPPRIDTTARPIHRRSRAGCLTCRLRRKRCPQVYNEDGVCERCAAGGYNCDRSSRPASRLPPSRDNSNESTTSVTSTSTNSSSSSFTPTSTSYLGGHFLFVPHDPSQAAPPAAAFPPALTHSPTMMDTLPLPDGMIDPLPLPPLPPPIPPIPTRSAPHAVYQPYTIAPVPVVAAPPIASGSGLPARRAPPKRKKTMGTVLSCSLLEWRVRDEGEDEGLLSTEAVEQHDLKAARSLYEEVDDGVLLSLPELARRTIHIKITQLVFGSDLPRLAALALSTTLRSKVSPGPAPNHTADRLVLRSDAYYQRAMGLLQSEGPSIEGRLVALLNIALFCLSHHGGAAGYSALSLVDSYIASLLGPSPIPYTPLFSEEFNAILRYAALWDILRCMGLGNRRTFFNYHGASAPYSLPAILLEGELVGGDGAFMRGVPVFLVLAMAATCNLAQDEGTLDPGQFLDQATALERAIEGWQAPSGLFGVGGDDVVERATSEMWRHAALINLRTSLYHLGPLHTSIRHSLKQIILQGSQQPANSASLFYEAQTLPPGSVTERSVPWFLAATVATEEGDRRVCRQAMAMGLPLRLAKDRLEGAERIWALVDSTGFPVDWRRALAAEGRYMAWS